MFIKPVPGRRVRDPVKGTFLPENGAQVPDGDLFWRNRLRDGDVIKMEKKAPLAQTQPKTHAQKAETPTNKKESGV